MNLIETILWIIIIWISAYAISGVISMILLIQAFFHKPKEISLDEAIAIKEQELLEIEEIKSRLETIKESMKPKIVSINGRKAQTECSPGSGDAC